MEEFNRRNLYRKRLKILWNCPENGAGISSGPRFLDSSLSEISAADYAVFFAMGLAPYTASGVCRFNV